MSSEACMRCGNIGVDRRTLWMDCLYAMEEIEQGDIPFEKRSVKIEPQITSEFYTLRVCKRCRADWMQAIGNWALDEPSGQDHDEDNYDKSQGPGTGIFIRRLGALTEITREEWDELYPGREPVVVLE